LIVGLVLGVIAAGTPTQTSAESIEFAPIDTFHLDMNINCIPDPLERPGYSGFQITRLSGYRADRVQEGRAIGAHPRLGVASESLEVYLHRFDWDSVEVRVSGGGLSGYQRLAHLYECPQQTRYFKYKPELDGPPGPYVLEVVTPYERLSRQVLLGDTTFPTEMTDDVASALLGNMLDDCNGNGHRDSVDIARGYAEDLDGDLRIDGCDTVDREDSHVASWRRGSEGKQFSAVQHYYTATIRYLVPRGGAQVSLKLFAPLGGRDSVLVRSQQQAAGSYELVWERDPLDPSTPPGEYELVLKIGSRTYSRRLGWLGY